jgi:hypothetical protein
MWTTFEDVNARYEKPLGDDRRAWVEQVIADAERRLVSKRPNLPSNITAGKVDTADVRVAVVNAVLRVIRNPEGYQSETEGNYVYTIAKDVAGGKLYFEADDLALVTPSWVPGATVMSSVPIGMPAHRVPVLRERPGWGWPG